MLPILQSKKILIGFLLFITILLYLPSLPNQFVWDDLIHTSENQTVGRWENLPKALRTLFSPAYRNDPAATLPTASYLHTTRPLASIWYFMVYSTVGPRPAIFRIGQIALHLINLILLFDILLLIFKSYEKKRALSLAFLICILYAIHPLNVESIQYISSFSTVLSALFCLLAFELVARGLNWKTAGQEHSHQALKPASSQEEGADWFIVGATGLLGLGLLAKETAVAGMAIILVYILMFHPKQRQSLWLYLICSGLLLGLYAFYRFQLVSIGLILQQSSLVSQASFSQRLLTIPYEIFSYLRLTFWPARLSVMHQYIVKSPADSLLWLPLFGLSTIAFGTWRMLRRTSSSSQRIAIFFLFWAGLNLLPILNLFPQGMTLADRWFYQGLFGLLTATIVLGDALIGKASTKIQLVASQWGLLLLGLICLGLVARTEVRIANWRDSLTLYQHDWSVDQTNPLLANNLGIALYEAGNVDEAIGYFTKAVELGHDKAHIYNNLGSIYQQRGNYEKALVYFKDVVDHSQFLITYRNYGNLLYKTGKDEQLKQFLEQQALPAFPHDAHMKILAGMVSARTGHQTEALSWLDQARHDDPNNPTVNEIEALIKQGKAIQF